MARAPLFRDRRDAGCRLAKDLRAYAGQGALVLALPRGGVPVAFEVAQALHGELDVLVARKLGVPGHEELAFGAIADGEKVLDEDTIAAMGIDAQAIRRVEDDERAEAARRTLAYRGRRPPPHVAGRTVILVDDGVATGSTARAALRSLRRQGPSRLVFAAPVGPAQAARSLRAEADDVVVAHTPPLFGAVGPWYEDFGQTTDAEVLDLLRAPRPGAGTEDDERKAAIPAPPSSITATLAIPPRPRGLVAFAHGSGSGRHSPRNRAVAARLRADGFATILADLLTPEEERVDDRTREHRFDIALLARRLHDVLAWARAQPRLRDLPVGLFGSSTGAAAALVAAAQDGGVAAVVSRGGRPDLAGAHLADVHCPTLLVVGGNDPDVLGLNVAARKRLAGPAELHLVPGATHLFEEPGALDDAADKAAQWFRAHLAGARPPRPRPKAGRGGVTAELGRLSTPLRGEASLDALVDRLGKARVVLLGEASHGTSEFYTWRARISMRLAREAGFSFAAVEGDWPDCFRLNRYAKGDRGVPATAHEALREFRRWPTWMWANVEVAAFLGDLRAHNRSARRRVGFYGLDVYSLWESLDALAKALGPLRPDAAAAVQRALRCFEPYGESGQAYARAADAVPEDCRDEVVQALVQTRSRLQDLPDAATEARLDAEQNAHVAVNAEAYYRAMVDAGPASWNLRDTHMLDTLDRLLRHHGPQAKGIVWAHNTHIGDARATDMAEAGMVNLGQLARERWPGEVAAVGFTSYEGSVIAGRAWEAPMQAMPVPSAPKGSLEHALHRLGGDRVVDLAGAQGLDRPLPHRAIGVVYHPEREGGNYVPTVVPQRYDALIHIDRSNALRPLHVPAEPEGPPETYPWGT